MVNNIKFKVTTPDNTEHEVKCAWLNISDNGTLSFRSTIGRNGREDIVRSFAHGHWAHVERITEISIV